MSTTPRNANNIDKHIASRIRARRLEASLSQTDLAKALGVTFQQIQKYENGANRFGAGRLLAIARALSTPITYFFEDAPSAGAGGRVVHFGVSALTIISGSRQGMDLVRAYNAISSAGQRRLVVKIAQEFAPSTIRRRVAA